MLQPTVRRTWAPRGQTPIHYSWDRHDRRSAIAAITLAPQRTRLGLYFDFQEENFNGESILGFLHWITRRLRRPILLVMDRLAAHRKAVRLLHEQLGDRADLVQVEWLPGYAPDLNPVENLWGHCKHGDLANFIPDDIERLQWAAEGSFTATEASLLRSFFKKSGLQL
jgi:transposase